MRSFLISLGLLFGTLLTIAQTEVVKINNFHIVYIYGPFKVNFIKSKAEKVEIDYNGINPEEVVIKSKDGELSIKLRNRSFFNLGNNAHWEGRNNRYARVTIHYIDVEAIEARAGAIIRASETIVSKQLFLVSKMGADMRLDINTKKLELDSSMGSEVDLTGVAETVDIRSKMGSNVDASFLQSQYVTVSSSMGSEVSVLAEKELNASADFGASITYKGNPPMKHTSKFLGAEVYPRKK